jgi:hypothetical protein
MKALAFLTLLASSVAARYMYAHFGRFIPFHSLI